MALEFPARVPPRTLVDAYVARHGCLSGMSGVSGRRVNAGTLASRIKEQISGSHSGG